MDDRTRPKRPKIAHSVARDKATIIYLVDKRSRVP